ncbi:MULTISPECIES: hypothetical protein [unclassified Microcoleus]|uniref:hypothetical protein n=1 Tax=unclassified Microcoleus TaxID=2642155 RepID=UPI002FD693ED
MGEANRRKRFDSNYGNSLNIGCFIAASTSSDAHAVYLGFGRKRSVERRLISAHASIIDAWKIFVYCQDILSKLKYFHLQSNDQITSNFISSLIGTYGDYSDDDAVYEVSGDKKALMDWLSQGKTILDDDLPSNINVLVVKPPVSKKYKVFWYESQEAPKNTYGNPEENCVFTVGKNSDEPISGGAHKKVILFSSYVTAAYVADYVNRLNRDSLTEEEVKRLLFEANRLQGKI